MAFNVVPGYDFSVNEVPTRAKFLQQALGVQITGIDLAQIQESIQAIVFGNTTGDSGAAPPAEGWIWVDPGGNRVVSVTNANWGHSEVGSPREDHRMWRSEGGWETIRWRSQGFAAGHNIIEGQHLWSNAISFAVKDVRNDMDLGFTPWGASAHAADSPASNLRVVCRGMMTARVNTQVTEIMLRTHRPGILTVSSGAQGWSVRNQFDGAFDNYSGTVMGPAHGSSTVSGGNTFPFASTWFVTRNMGKS